MVDDSKLFDSPEGIAEEGQRIYAERHQARLEEAHLGEFAAIDVLTGEAYVGRFAEDALGAARVSAPNGVFHLVRIGSPGAFKVSFGKRHGFWSGALRPAR